MSRILNGGNKAVWASMAERQSAVRKIADELGYKPNFLARSLRNRKSHTIALVFGQASPLLNGVYETLAGSIVAVLESYHYHLLFLPLPPASKRRWPLDLLSNGRVDGCIAMDPLPPVIVSTLQSCGLPFVAVNADGPMPGIRPDDVGGVRAAVGHLADLGHRRIALYIGPKVPTPHFSVGLRRRAFQDEMARRGWADDAVVIDDSYEAFVAWLTAQPAKVRPTAVIVYQAAQAMPIQRMLIKGGIRIPADLSLMTFDDLPALSWMSPSMTTVDVPIAVIGERAARLLLSRVEDGNELPTQPELVPETLIARESTAAPPRAAS